MTPPPREYWRVWSDGLGDYEADENDVPIECYSLEDAQRRANQSNETARMMRWRHADWRPVHCREVVIDG